MYSAISAEVPLPTDPTNFNADLYKGCVDTEKLVVCGQALSHCVNFTVRDIHQRVVETGDLAASDMYLLSDGEHLVVCCVYANVPNSFLLSFQKNIFHLCSFLICARV